MAKNDVYRIKIVNWEKHNPKRKTHYKYTLISNNLIHDSKLRVLPVSVRYMWIAILLIAGDHSRDTVELSERQLRDILESSWSIERALDAFQSFQMVTWDILNLPPPPNRIEENRIEENRKVCRSFENQVSIIPGSTKKEKSDLPDEDFDLNENKESNTNDFDFTTGPKGACHVVTKLQGIPHLEQALSWVPKTTQSRWVNSYVDTFELRKSLSKGVEYIYPRLNEQERTQLTRWASWLGGWLDSDKRLRKGIPGDNSMPELTVYGIFGKDAKT